MARTRKFRSTSITGKVDGNAISSWVDDTASGNNLVQATGGNQPIYKTNILGAIPAVRFDGTDDLLKGVISSDVTFTIYVVAQKRNAPAPTTVQTVFTLYDWDGGGTPLLFGSRSDESATGFMAYPNAGYGTTALGGTAVNAQIVGWRSNSTTSLEYIINGARAGAFDPVDVVGTSLIELNVGAAGGFGEPGDFDIFGIDLYDTARTDVEMRGDLQALALEFGVTGPPVSPFVSSAATEQGTSLGANQVISMPASISVGDVLLCFATSDAPTAGVQIVLDAGAPSQTWTVLHQSSGPGTNVIRGAVFGKIADGTDALTLDGDAQDYCARVVAIKDHGLTSISQLVNGATPNLLIPATGTTGNANPPSVDLGRVDGLLWLAVAMVDATTANTISAVPSGYTALGTTQTSVSSTTSVLMQVAALETSSDQVEDPGTFTNTSRNWIAYTVGIPRNPGTTSWTGAAALAGAGTVAATAVVTHLATATLAGTGTVAGAAVVTHPAAASVNATGTLAPAALVTHPAGATIGGTGAVNAGATVLHPAAATATGTGTLSAAATVTTSSAGAAALAGSGTVAAVASVHRFGGAALAGTGTVSTAAVRTATAAAVLSGAGLLTAAGLRTLFGAVALSGTGVLVAVAAAPPDHNPITVSIRDHGHTTTVHDDGHTLALRDHGHTARER